MQLKSSTSPKSDAITLRGLSHEKRWVCWTGEGDNPKRPYQVDGRTPASNDKPATWGTRRAAEKAAERFPEGGIGVMLGPLKDGSGLALGGIDHDKQVGPDRQLSPISEEIDRRFRTFAEVSPSGRGLHHLFLYQESDLLEIRKLMGNDHGISFKHEDGAEIALYTGNKYFTVSGDDLDFDWPLRVVSVDDIRWLIEDAGPRHARSAQKVAGEGGDDSGSGRAQSLAVKMRAIGDLIVDFHDAIEGTDDPKIAAWYAKPEAGYRGVKRCWEKAGEYLAEQRAEIKRYGLEHDGVIRAFTDRHRGELAFDHHVGKWFRFDGNTWRPEDTKRAHHYARERSIELARLDPTAKHLKNVPTWEAVERGARTDPAFSVKSDRWNRDKWLLGTPGGTVELATGKLREGRPEDYISRVTAVAPIPLDEFKPERDCPRWLDFLEEALAGDAEAIRFLQQWFGYSLTGETKDQCLLFVHGPGGSGKSTAINTLGEILGDYAVTAASETFAVSKNERHPEELARLHGARFVRSSETDHGSTWNENRIKLLTGQDTITARYMRCDSFEFKPEFKLTIFGNNAPAINNVDSAIERRLIVLPFDNPPEKKDERLPEKLKAEWNAILSWAMRGCLDWQKKGLVRPSSAIQAIEEYLTEHDPFRQWLAECCEVDARHVVKSGDLWKSWCSFCELMGFREGKPKGFSNRLQGRGFKLIRDTDGIRGRGYVGLRLKR